MKLLSEASEYGLRAVIWMAQCRAEPQKVKDIAREIRAAPGYLVKVLQELTRAGVLSARRGSQGGFTLESDPSLLTVLDVINAIDPFERIRSCPLMLEGHSVTLCPVHRSIDDAMQQIEDSFRQLTIADVVQHATASRTQCRRLSPHLWQESMVTLPEAAADHSP
jgi:Rrf2 family protein